MVEKSLEEAMTPERKAELKKRALSVLRECEGAFLPESYLLDAFIAVEREVLERVIDYVEPFSRCDGRANTVGKNIVAWCRSQGEGI